MGERSHESGPIHVPPTAIDQLLAPLTAFLRIEAASGIVLLLATATALVLANSPASAAYAAFWQTDFALRFGQFELHHNLQEWVNDGLMVIFFFVVGMEVKRELVVGELREVKRAILPLVAALGGMVAPACLYLLTLGSNDGTSGWGIPMATDIAFVVGCMAVLGRRVPHGLRVMMLTLAIADDIGAILVIAIGYSHGLSWPWLAAAVGVTLLIGLMRFIGVRSLIAYGIAGLLLWIAVKNSGVHATIAGVILGLLTPAKPVLSKSALTQAIDWIRHRASQTSWDTDHARAAHLRQFHHLTSQAISPLEYLVEVLHPWVSFVIMPIFALANAGVQLGVGHLASPVAMAVVVGLLIGKPVGVFAASFIAIKTRLAELPDGVGWKHLAGGGCLAGIGFTMALFIAALALDPQSLDPAKVGVLLASLLSAVAGSAILLSIKPGPPQTPISPPHPESGRPA